MRKKRMGLRLEQRTTQVQTLRQRRVVLVTSLVLLLLFGGIFLINMSQHEEAMAANTVTWTNGTGNGNWNDAGNWSTGAIPGTNDIATFNTTTSNCLINANISISGIAITSSYTGTVTQQNGKTITLAASGFNQAGGTFNGGTSTIDINSGTFTLSNGTFTSTAGGIYIGGNYNSNVTLFTHSGGTFNHNNGLVAIDPSVNGWAGTPTFTVDVLTNTKFYDFLYNGSTCCNTNRLATATGDTIDVENDFTHADGFITGNIEVKNNLNVNSGTDGGSGVIIINGTGAQTYSTTGTHRTTHIYIDKPSGTFMPGGGTSNLYTQKFTLVNGDFTAPSGTLAAGGTWGSSQNLFTHSGGTFTANNGTVLIDPAVNSWTGSPTFTLDVLNSTYLYNLIFNASTCCNTAIIASASGDTIDAENNFTHTDGFISATLEVKNDLSIAAGTDGGSGIIYINGSGTQRYSTTGSHRTCHIFVDKPSGTFSAHGGTSNLYMQKFTLNNGNFTAPSGTMAIGGAWGSSQTLFTHSGGTFDANNGNVTFDPTTNSWTGSPTYSLDVTSSTSFYDVTLTAATCCNTSIIATASGDTVDVQHNLAHNDGFISGAFELKNNLSVGAGTDGGSGIIVVNGSGSQTYSTTGSHRTCHIYVDKTSGSFDADGGTSSLYIQKFSLTNGAFSAPSGIMAIGGAWGSSQTLFSHSGGTFDANNGVVTIDPTTNSWTGSPTYTLDVLNTTTFYDITLNAATCCNTSVIATASGDTVDVAHNLTHSDGFISGNFEMKNNLSVGTGTDGGSGVIIVNGTGGQTYTTTGSHRTCHIYIDKSGDFQAAGGTTSLYLQKFSLVSGNFHAPSGTLAVGGAWGSSQNLFTHSGGNFHDSNGTVLFDPVVNSWTGSPTFTFDVIPSTQLYNLTLNASTCCNTAIIASAAGDSVEVKNNLTHSDGSVSGTFQLKNNLIVNSGSDGGTGVIYIDGSSTQTYTTNGSHLTCHLSINKAAGAFEAAGGTTSLYIQKFTLANGTFNAPSGTLAVGGNWGSSQTLFTHSGGTLNNNSGTLLINPNVTSWASNPTFTFDIINNTVFNNLNINATTCCNTAIVTTAANDTIDIEGTLTYTDGRSNATIEAAGSITVGSAHDGGSGKLIFKGSADQNFDLTGATSSFDNDIIINKASGKVILASACVLNAATQRMTFTKGNIETTSSNLLTYGDNFTVSGASDSSHVEGPVSKIGNDAFTFPIGADDTLYAALRISAPATTTSQFTAEYFHVNPTSLYNIDSKDVALHHVSGCEYWNLDQVSGTSNITVTLSWATRSCGVAVVSELALARWNGTQWRSHGNGGTTGTIASGTISSSSIMSNFGPMTLGSSTGNNTLPIELIKFEAKYDNPVVHLEWITASEENNDFFTIEKSTNLNDITEVSRVKGAGNSLVQLTYTDIDENPFDGISYYRLKQTDYDGKFAYSEWVKVLVKKSVGEPMVKVYPNPSDGININLEISDLQHVPLTIRLSDLSGKEIFSRELEVESTHEVMPLGQPQQLIPGTYAILIAADDKKFSYKLIVK